MLSPEQLIACAQSVSLPSLNTLASKFEVVRCRATFERPGAAYQFRADHKGWGAVHGTFDCPLNGGRNVHVAPNPVFQLPAILKERPPKILLDTVVLVLRLQTSQ